MPPDPLECWALYIVRQLHAAGAAPTHTLCIPSLLQSLDPPQHDQTLIPFSAKGVACESRCHPSQMHITGFLHACNLSPSFIACCTLEVATTTFMLIYSSIMHLSINVTPHHTLTGQMMGIIWGFDWLPQGWVSSNLPPSLRGFDCRVCPTIGAIDISFS